MIKYSKILLLNDDGFSDLNGGGITIKNLFAGWPIDKIAVAYWNNSIPMKHIATNYYKLGYMESHFMFPLNYLSNEPKDNLNGPFTVSDENTEDIVENVNEIPEKQPSSNFIKQAFLSTIAKTGLSEFVHPLKASPTFVEWVKEYNPDIIYCQCGDLGFVNIVLETQKITNAKLVVHIMDDWPSTVYKNVTLAPLLRLLTISRFKKILKIASLRLGISKAMAEEFEKRYGLPFHYFHNPIDSDKHEHLKTKEINKNKEYLVVYSGRIGIASHYSIKEFCQCVAELRSEGVNIRFNIYTGSYNVDVDVSTIDYEGTNILPSLEDNTFMEKLNEADLLLYPVDFDDKSIEYIRLSFPTKLPPYLLSRVPILSYGPQCVHSIDIIKNNKLGFVCTQQSNTVLKTAIIDALTNEACRTLFADNALEFAKNHFERKKVVNSFHNMITSTVD